MKLATNIYHVSGHCLKRFQGQRSKVKVTASPDALLWRRHAFRQCRVEAHLKYSRQATMSEAERNCNSADVVREFDSSVLIELN